MPSYMELINKNEDAVLKQMQVGTLTMEGPALALGVGALVGAGSNAFLSCMQGVTAGITGIVEKVSSVRDPRNPRYLLHVQR